jgi:hypothetical protein
MDQSTTTNVSREKKRLGLQVSDDTVRTSMPDLERFPLAEGTQQLMGN